MKRLQVTKRGKAGTLAVLALLIAACLAPAPASAATAQFSLSRTSGMPGLSVFVTQVTPCPSGVVNQFVRFSFRDAGGSTVSYNADIPVDQATGKWARGAKLSMLLSYALGQGQVMASCYQSGEWTATQEYVPMRYTIAGSVADFSFSQPSYTQGQQMQASSITPCPASAFSMTGKMWGRTQAGRDIVWDLYPNVNQTTGKWSVVATLPKTVIAPTLQNAPVGKYSVQLWCSLNNIELMYPTKYIDVKSFAHYVALGDSYSSGEGTFNYDPSSKGCHRSPQSYVYHVASAKSLGAPLFAACSGAQTNDFYDTNPNNLGESPQLTRLNGDTKYVTLTIGGNDAGFARVINDCATFPKHTGFRCSTNQSLVDAVRSHLSALSGVTSGVAEDSRKIESLRNVYRSVRDRAPGAKIFVAGYPRLFGSDRVKYIAASDAPSGRVCQMTALTLVDYADAQWINSQADALNGVIQRAVTDARADGVDVSYVPPALFAGHAQCDSMEEWINTIVLDDAQPIPHPKSESMHPNVTGHSAGYGAAFVSVMNLR